MIQPLNGGGPVCAIMFALRLVDVLEWILFDQGPWQSSWCRFCQFLDCSWFVLGSSPFFAVTKSGNWHRTASESNVRPLCKKRHEQFGQKRLKMFDFLVPVAVRHYMESAVTIQAVCAAVYIFWSWFFLLKETLVIVLQDYKWWCFICSAYGWNHEANHYPRLVVVLITLLRFLQVQLNCFWTAHTSWQEDVNKNDVLEKSHCARSSGLKKFFIIVCIAHYGVGMVPP